ncbi:MAG TPA: potassium channel family protein, partial [Ardenticatenaceae bacterium]|nr:potassium channel family protein [Ardenticatenaceae bacterium]
MAQQLDYLQAFTGVPSDRVLGWLRQQWGQREALELRLVNLLTETPLEANAAFLLSCSVAFLAAERGANPSVKTFVDALYYISTCLQTGYADVFPVTQAGKAIATLAMTVGPALSNELLDPPHRAAGAS